MFKYQFFSLLIFLNFQLTSFAQESLNLAEKFYVHTDRTSYVAGEEIKFKAYSLNIHEDNKSPLSKVLYLNVVDKNGETIGKKKFQINANGSFGSIKIPENANSGYYFVYAYTKWQRNFGLEGFAVKKIFVINSQSGISYQAQNQRKPKFEMLFFPEGGILNAGAKNKVAYFLKDKNGQLLSAKGKILNEKGEVVARFESGENKIGTFIIEALNNMQYKALAYIGNDSIMFHLPKSKAIGYAFNIDKSTDNYVTVYRSKPFNKAPADALKLEIEYNGFTYLSYTDSLTSNEYNIKIPKKSFIPGTSRIIFRNTDNEILYDRFIDVYRKELMDVQLKVAKVVYSKNEKVLINLKAIYYQQPQVNANLSVSVYRLGDQDFSSEYHDFSNIATSSILSPVLTEILNPQQADIKDVYKNLNDYLLVSENPDKFKKGIKFLPETKGPYLSGIIQNDDLNHPIEPDLAIFATFLDSVRSTYTIQPDAQGQFIQLFPDKFGLHKVFFQYNGKFSNYQMIFDNDFVDSFPPYNMLPPYINESKKESLKRLMLNYQIMKQFNGNPLITKKTDNLENLFYGIPDSSYILQKYIDLPTMEEVFNNIILNVLVKKRKNEYQIAVYDENNLPLNFSLLILVDGLPITNLETVLKIHPLKVKKISVINSNYLIGERYFGGIISIFSKENDFAGIKLPSTAQIIDFELITPSNEILAKDFSDLKTEKHLPDLRNTIYWNPEIITDNSGNANFSFYTSDETGKFIIRVEGISAEGSPGVGYFVYEVTK
ncbi:MAG: MG2 domain-containing protein [Bacteroidales bacterium]|nr:MG2 domain-containing protein [Bacteroidales bacterium]